MPVRASRRLMSIRTNAALDREAASATAVEAQQATAILSSRSSRSSRARPGRSQIQTRSPTGVGRAHKISGRLPVRLVMMNSEKQVRMRCRVIRHHRTWWMRVRTGLMAAGTPTISDHGGQPVEERGVLGEFDPAEDQARRLGRFRGSTTRWRG